MEEQLIRFDTAKLAKEKGFNIPVYYHYTENPVNDLLLLVEPNDPQLGQGWILEDYNLNEYNYKKYSAPTQSFLQKWLREKHNIYANVQPVIYVGDEIASYYQPTINGSTITKLRYETWEDALEISNRESLKLIE